MPATTRQIELEAEAVLDELDDVVDNMLYSFDAQHHVDVYERLQQIPKAVPSSQDSPAGLDTTPIGKQHLQTRDPYYAAYSTPHNERHAVDTFLDDSPPAPASARFDRMRTATPSDALQQHPAVRDDAKRTPTLTPATKATTAGAAAGGEWRDRNPGPAKMNFDDEDGWVDDCLREVDNVLLDLEGPGPRGRGSGPHDWALEDEGEEGGELVEGQQVLERMRSQMEDDRALQQRRGANTRDVVHTAPPQQQHLQLVNRLSLWEERKEMKRMLGLYTKLVSEQAECTFHPAINPAPAYVSGASGGNQRRASSTRGLSVGTHSSRHPVPGFPPEEEEEEDEAVPFENVGGGYDERGVHPPPPPRPIKGYDTFLQRMQTAREERELPQREEQDRLARYRDPTTFQRNPTTPEPFHLTSTSPASSSHHSHCVPHERPRSARSSSATCAAGAVSVTGLHGTGLYVPSSSLPGTPSQMGQRRSSSRSGSATGSSVSSSPRPSTHLIQPAVRLQAPGTSSSATAPSADGYTTSVAPLGGGTPRSGTGHVTGIGAGQRKPKLRDIAADVPAAPSAGNNSGSRGGAPPRLLRRGAATGVGTSAATSPSADLYRTLGATLRKDLFSPELSAQLQQHRCTASGGVRSV